MMQPGGPRRRIHAARKGDSNVELGPSRSAVARVGSASQNQLGQEFSEPALGPCRDLGYMRPAGLLPPGPALTGLRYLRLEVFTSWRGSSPSPLDPLALDALERWEAEGGSPAPASPRAASAWPRACEPL